MKQKVSVDVRVDASTKARWQADADAAGVPVGELVRRRMQIYTPRAQAPPNLAEALAAVDAESAARASLDLEADVLRPLRSWFDLRDCDGETDSEQLADWRGYADHHGITFDNLLERVVVDVNAALV